MLFRSVAELERQLSGMRDLHVQLREVVVELAAALVRLDKNGYQERLLEKTLKQAGVKREQVDTFNEQRAANIAQKWPRP